MGMFSAMPVIGKVVDIIGEHVTDKDLANKLTAGIQAADYSLAEKAMEVQAQVLIAEMTGNKLQRNWRPHLMYLIMGLLLYLVIVAPLIGAATGWPLASITVEALKAVPAQLWNLLTIGVGGYVVGRSVEKTAQNWGASRDGS